MAEEGLRGDGEVGTMALAGDGSIDKIWSPRADQKHHGRAKKEGGAKRKGKGRVGDGEVAKDVGPTKEDGSDNNKG